MAGNERDVAQEDADPIGPPGHAGGTYGEGDLSQAARRSEYRTDQATDSGFQETRVMPAEPGPAEGATRGQMSTATTVGKAERAELDEVNSKAAQDLDF